MAVNRLVRTSPSLPLRAAEPGVKATTTIAATSVNIAATGTKAAVSTGIDW